MGNNAMARCGLTLMGLPGKAVGHYGTDSAGQCLCSAEVAALGIPGWVHLKDHGP